MINFLLVKDKETPTYLKYWFSKTRLQNLVFNKIFEESKSGTNFYLENTIENPLKINLKASESTQDGEPTPESPQDIHVVKGDNEIVIENKNLFDKNNANYVSNLTFNDDFSKFQTTTNPTRVYYIECEHNKTYTIHKTVGTILRCGNCNTIPAVNGDISSSYRDTGTNQVTFTTNSTDKYIYLYLLTGIESQTISYDDVLQTLQVEKNSQATPYTEHKEQNYPISLGVKNLFSSILEQGGIRSVNGSNNDSGSQLRTRIRTKDYIKINSLEKYTLTYLLTTLDFYGYYYDSSKNFLGVLNDAWLSQPATFTTITNAKYIRFTFRKSNDSNITIDEISNIQLEEGTIAHSYSPYGVTPIEMCKIGNYADEIFKNVPECEYYDDSLEVGKWYKLAKIGKVVLDGSENWQTNGTIGTDYRHALALYSWSDSEKPIDINYTYLSNYFVAVNRGNNSDIFGKFYAAENFFVFHDKNAVYDNDGFKNWLSTNNTLVCYVTKTPTKTPLSDTLQEELDNLEENAKTYDYITNINQVNDDRPFILDISYYRKVVNHE